MALETTQTHGSAISAARPSADLSTTGAFELVIRQVPSDHPHALRLVAEVQEEYVRRYGNPDESPVSEEEFVPPHGAFFVGYLTDDAGEVPVATGAWRDLTEPVPDQEGVSVAELKRMYVRPEAQRRGVARRMLAHVEADAAAAGHHLMVLGTGDRQPEAMAMYTSAGYAEIPGFGHYAETPGSRHYARRLVSEDGSSDFSVPS